MSAAKSNVVKKVIIFMGNSFEFVNFFAINFTIKLKSVIGDEQVLIIDTVDETFSGTLQYLLDKEGSTIEEAITVPVKNYEENKTFYLGLVSTF